MNQDINQSINFLISEYQRLKTKKKNKKITKEELETLRKLSTFLNKDNE